MTPNDTIFALSTGQPPAAIAVVRISGRSANQALTQLAGRLPEPRRAVLADLTYQGELLDRALVLRFDAPSTVTGEDLVELHLHGGRAVVAAVAAALARMDGLRAAEPGEFTRRAFANGRIDLAEAEGLADLLAAETEGQRRAALQLAGGMLSRRVEDWTRRVVALAAAVEAQLDFSDEGDVAQGLSPAWASDRAALAGEIEQMLARPPAERLRDGVRVVLAGPPNSGKSTLLNALAGREAAITSDVPGTTRDLVEASVVIAGLPLLLIDSAGLRESEDRVERIGVDRAQAAVASADLVLWLGNPSARPAREGVITVATKADLNGTCDAADISVSAVSGRNLNALVERLVREVTALLPGPSEAAVNARQRVALGDAASHLSAAGSQSDLLIVAEELRHARAALDQITGRAGVEDMLDALFGRFCIGK